MFIKLYSGRDCFSNTAASVGSFRTIAQFAIQLENKYRHVIQDGLLVGLGGFWLNYLLNEWDTSPDPTFGCFVMSPIIRSLVHTLTQLMNVLTGSPWEILSVIIPRIIICYLKCIDYFDLRMSDAHQIIHHIFLGILIQIF